MNKKLLLTVVIAMLVTVTKAADKKESVKSDDGKNLIKLNLTGLPLRTYSGTYERAIGKKISAGIGFRYMGEGKLPFLDDIKSAIDDPETNKHISNLKLGNYAITPEVKFYMGKGVFRGFYIAPFVRYAVYSADLPFEFTYEDQNNIEKTEKIPLSGNVTTITGGLMFGAQWKLSKRIYLDWMILGPNAGSAKGDITGNKTLSDDERDGLQKEIDKLKDSDIPMLKLSGEATNNGARIDFSGPWAGLRAGINLGFRF
ncbi:DUF3575 domain-containing protein [Pseudopedobacter beijingensis]|uniref:DUF3575 domain-containing protein n=1 Tax=Pseudopedobacter beijingensis TaxID=1207056 RepID=A0ABW4IC84_9SPHI